MSRSYKSTIAGFAVAVLNLLANGISLRQAIFSASLLALGLMAKDYDVSGAGQTVQDSRHQNSPSSNIPISKDADTSK